jgi:shikimate kinase
MSKSERIYLTGFMTSGKSTIGPITANVLGWDFFDLDSVIEDNEKTTIVNIFEKKGEQYFRDLETKTLKELSDKKNVVISLGGGTINSQENFSVIRETGLLVYLKVSPEVLYRRLKNKLNRPLFRDLVLEKRPKKDFIERIQRILDEREVYYNQADLIINTDLTRIGITVDKLANKIKKMIDEKS